MARKRANLSDLLNNLTFRKTFDKWKLLACSHFEYDGLPDGIEARHIENFLFEHGKAIFFRAKGMGFMCLEAQNGGNLNVYGDPLGYWANGFQFHEWVDSDDCVIIENNPHRLNTKDFVLFYVNKLTEAERTMDVNVKAVKTPYIISCDDRDVLTLKQIFREIDGNTPAIFTSKKLNVDALKVLLTGANFLGNDLMDYKKSVENDLLTFLGFNNIAVDKKERLNVDEANSNNELISGFAELQLSSRQLALDRINEKWGLHITVRLKGVSDDVDNEPIQDDEADR